MPKLKCDVKNCVYNADMCCCKSIIKIVGDDALKKDDTTCASFHKRKRVDTNDIYKEEFAKFEGINQYISIECESRHCLYNIKDICTAEKVKIAGGAKAQKALHTQCSSFVPRT